MAKFNVVKDILGKFTTLNPAWIPLVAQAVATDWGRLSDSDSVEIGVKCSISGKGVRLGASEKGGLPDNTANRLFACASQLEQVVSKLTGSKGFYRVRLETLPKVFVSPEIVDGLLKSIDGLSVVE